MSSPKKTNFEELMYLNLYYIMKDNVTNKEFLVRNLEQFERYGFVVEPKFARKLIERQEKPIKMILNLGVLRAYRISVISNFDSFHIKDMILLIYENTIDTKDNNKTKKWIIGMGYSDNDFKDDYYSSKILERILGTLSETLTKNAILVKYEHDKEKQILYFGFLVEYQKFSKIFEELQSKGIDDKKDTNSRIKLLHGEYLGDLKFFWIAIDELEFEQLVRKAF